jgi:hypothetical protein
MASKMYKLKQQIETALPPGLSPWYIFGRVRLKTSYSLAKVQPDTEATPEEFEQVKRVVEEILGIKINV